MPSGELVPVAALRLLLQRGFDTTSVDEIAAAAGLSRSTFFRRYGSKEAMVFADREERLAAASLALRTHADEGVHALVPAALGVFDHHTARPELSQVRWDLLHEVASLRDRELVSTHRFERLFLDHLLTVDVPGLEPATQRRPHRPDARYTWAVALAASTVAVHNAHLRSWLRDPDDEVRRALRSALVRVIDRSLPGSPGGSTPVVVVVRGDEDPAQVGAAVERELRGH